MRLAKHPISRQTALLTTMLLCAVTPAEADYLGNAQILVHEFGYCDGPPVIQPLANVEVVFPGLTTVVTDSAGNWSMPGGAADWPVYCTLWTSPTPVDA